MFPHRFIPHDPAAYAVADQDDMLSDRSSEYKTVKGRDPVEFVGGHVEHLRDAPDLVRDPTPVPLHDLQRVYAGTLFMGRLFKLLLYLPSLVVSRQPSPHATFSSV